MSSYNIHAAKTHLSRLVDAAVAGEEVVIARAGRPVARIVPLADAAQPRTPGVWRGAVWVAEDFDAPLPPESLTSSRAPSRSRRRR